ncbi:MAG TPA: hypothetical protein VEU29_00315 [Actinomycetota bacterium]|nr:hypothetical protein [Actinomycetota bacterium]
MDSRRRLRDESGIVGAWLLQVLVGLALVGVVLYDAGSIVINFLSLQGTADEIAIDVATDLGREAQPNLECARRSPVPECRVIQDVAREKGVKIVTARFDADGAFHVEVRNTADTLIVGRIGAIEDWATATASAEADTN